MIVVFGSINADLVARTENLPSAGETVTGDDLRILPGGKGANQALAARKQGADVMFLGAIGRDEFATSALANLDEHGVHLKHVAQLDDIATGTALIVVDSAGENSIVVCPGANARAEPSSLEYLELGHDDLLITQHEVPLQKTVAALKIARSKGMITLHNAAPALPLEQSTVALIDYLIVNETEVVTLYRAQILEPSSANQDRLNMPNPEHAARILSETSGTKVVLTLGAQGAVLCNGKSQIRATAPKVDVVDTTGAGDTFVGTFAASLQRGESDERALLNAVTAGALACRSVGAQSSTPSLDEVGTMLSSE